MPNDAQLENLGRRLSPIMDEHCDAWVMVGIKAGGSESIYVGAEPSEALDDLIIDLAVEIKKRRERKSANGKT